MQKQAISARTSKLADGGIGSECCAESAGNFQSRVHRWIEKEADQWLVPAIPTANTAAPSSSSWRSRSCRGGEGGQTCCESPSSDDSNSVSCCPLAITTWCDQRSPRLSNTNFSSGVVSEIRVDTWVIYSLWLANLDTPRGSLEYRRPELCGNRPY